jgi:5-amino-6-(5-phospho-D-ribitylamino)uracil phosphatase
VLCSPQIFHIANSRAEVARRNWCFKTHATEVTKEPSHHDEDTDNGTVCFNDVYYKLPKSPSWLLEPEEKNNKLSLSIKPLLKKREHHKNSFGVILEWKGVIVEEDDPEIEPRLWHALSLSEKKTWDCSYTKRN